MKVIKVFLLAVLIVIIAAFAGATLGNAETPKPTKEDYQNLEDIKENQKGLAETRSAYMMLKNAVESGVHIEGVDPDRLIRAYNEFLDFKQSNEAKVTELNRNGWNVDWSTMKLIPFQPGTPSSPQQAKVTKTAPVSVKLQNTTGGSSHTYVWLNAPAYKNDRLKAYQGMLAARGITDREHIKLLLAQLLQENGSLSESVHGDGGCSVGILQYNACVHHSMSAKRFLAKYPEWQSWEYQLERMADMVADRYEIYDGDIKRVIVHHNRPVSAKAGKDTPAGYFKAVSSRLPLLTTL